MGSTSQRLYEPALTYAAGISAEPDRPMHERNLLVSAGSRQTESPALSGPLNVASGSPQEKAPPLNVAAGSRQEKAPPLTGPCGNACATRLLPFLFLLLAAPFASAQQGPSLKHRVFAYWGYNRAQFTTSSIHFTGSNYDFILHDVEAKDRPETFTLNNYFNPKNIWIPQYNYRVGWFLNDRWSFSLGLDHMKYVVVKDQQVKLTGNISRERSPAYATSGEAGEVRITPDFLTYEHTDGLNLLAVDGDHYDALWTSKSGKQALYFTEGLFVGPVIPRTDVRLFGEGINNKFHLAGYGAGAKLGLFAVVLDRLFVSANVRAGYIELPSVLTTGTSTDRASQHFWFVQQNAVIGVLIGKGGQ